MQRREGFYWRATSWATEEIPADNAIAGDRAMTVGLGARREPFPGGAICRALEIPPDTADVAEHQGVLAELNREVAQKHLPFAADLARHPSMHRTDTLDFITCVRGEKYLVTDADEVLMGPGDTVVIRGVNHAWPTVPANPACSSAR